MRLRSRLALAPILVWATAHCSASGGAEDFAEAGSGGGMGSSSGGTGRTDGGTPSQGPTSDSGQGFAGDASQPVSPPSEGGSPGSDGGPWAGLRVAGIGFVDGAGTALIPRGIGIGEWHNIESYMLDLNLKSDSPGMGESELRAALVKAMGQAGADQFFATWEANVVTPADVALWASWGVNTVRLPMNYRTLSSADGTWIEAGFQVVDQFVQWCKQNGIYVILDLHAAPGSQNCEEMSDTADGIAHLWKDPSTYRQWTIDLWQAIAKRYAGETAVGGYDIFDEPYDVESSGTFSSGVSTLRQMYLDVTTAIRAVDPNHVLFFEGTNWSSIDPGSGGTNGFAGLEPAWDPQMAWSFHKYWDDNTTAAIQGYLDLRASTQRPVWNGETGEDSTNGWSGAMIHLLEANEIGWNEWTYKKVANSADFYSIPAPANWAKMQTYLQGGAMPSQVDANTIMMALADGAATSKCTLQAPWLKEIFGK